MPAKIVSSENIMDYGCCTQEDFQRPDLQYKNVCFELFRFITNRLSSHSTNKSPAVNPKMCFFDRWSFGSSCAISPRQPSSGNLSILRKRWEVYVPSMSLWTKMGRLSLYAGSPFSAISIIMQARFTLLRKVEKIRSSNTV